MEDLNWDDIETLAILEEARRKALDLMTTYYDEGQERFISRLAEHCEVNANEVITGFVVLSEFLLTVAGKQMGMTGDMLAHGLLNLAQDH